MANGRKELEGREPDKRKSYVGAAFGGERNGVRYDVSGIRKGDTDFAGRVNLTDGNDRLGLAGRYSSETGRKEVVIGGNAGRWGDLDLVFEDSIWPSVKYAPSAFAKRQVAKYAIAAGLGALALYLLFR